jgi:hypothetical protein
VSTPGASVTDVSTCPDCRYCDPAAVTSSRKGLPHPARWFDQPCPACFHRLKAHDPGVPRALAGLATAGAGDLGAVPGTGAA